MTTRLALVTLSSLVALACAKQETPDPESEPAAASEEAEQHASNIPPLDENNIVSLAQASEDHTTLVEAIKAADYVTSVAASGPLTVFAPTNAAFEELPDGTLEDLLKPENADKLRKILQNHVTTSAVGVDALMDGQTVAMVGGAKFEVSKEGDEVRIGDAKIISSTRASNGMLHVVDGVLLPE
ncbi:MAG: fasciclin domain-containing protein [Myxococcota bacterium]